MAPAPEVINNNNKLKWLVDYIVTVLQREMDSGMYWGMSYLHKKIRQLKWLLDYIVTVL